MAEFAPRRFAHTLWNEGAPFSADRRRLNPGGVGGEGRAVCSCGELSPVLPSSVQRRAWHRRHKDEAQT